MQLRGPFERPFGLQQVRMNCYNRSLKTFILCQTQAASDEEDLLPAPFHPNIRTREQAAVQGELDVQGGREGDRPLSQQVPHPHHPTLLKHHGLWSMNFDVATGMPLLPTCSKKPAPAAPLTLKRAAPGCSGWSRSSPARSSL